MTDFVNIKHVANISYIIYKFPISAGNANVLIRWAAKIKHILIAYFLSALTLLVGWLESIWPVKNWVMGSWCGYLSGAKCNWFAYGPPDATTNPIITCIIKIQNGSVFLVSSYQVVLEMRLLNGCSKFLGNMSAKSYQYGFINTKILARWTWDVFKTQYFYIDV